MNKELILDNLDEIKSALQGSLTSMLQMAKDMKEGSIRNALSQLGMASRVCPHSEAKICPLRMLKDTFLWLKHKDHCEEFPPHSGPGLQLDWHCDCWV